MYIVKDRNSLFTWVSQGLSKGTDSFLGVLTKCEDVIQTKIVTIWFNSLLAL